MAGPAAGALPGARQSGETSEFISRRYVRVPQRRYVAYGIRYIMGLKENLREGPDGFISGFGCRRAAFGRDLTFFVWSDTHFGAYDYADTTRLEVIRQMNGLPGTRYPAEIFEDAKVGRPAFLLHLGDITEHGLAGEWDDPNLADQRSYMRTLRYLTVTDKIYEVAGNHDSRQHTNIRGQIARRQDNTYYAFEMEGVHFVVLDLYTHLNGGTPSLDDEQLDWLRAYLDRIDDTTPVIIAMLPPPQDARRRVVSLGRRYLEHPDSMDKNVLAFSTVTFTGFAGRWSVDTVVCWFGLHAQGLLRAIRFSV